MRIVDADATARALPFERLIAALREAFRGGVSVPPRTVVEIAGEGDDATTALVMPAYAHGRHFGVKVVAVAPGNAARGLPALHATYVLHEAASGVPRALLDGDVLTARRTAATSALAASHLAREEARRLLVVGAGRVARLLPAAYRAVRPIERVELWARDADKAQALVAHWRDEGFDAQVAGDLAAAVARADVVACATLSREPLVRGGWLRPGSHLDLIGSFAPRMREADDAAFAGASIWVDTDEALAKSGDLLGPLSRGAIARADVRGDLAALVRGEVPGRRDAAERTVFKSVGSALEDLAAAVLACESSPP